MILQNQNMQSPDKQEYQNQFAPEQQVNNQLELSSVSEFNSAMGDNSQIQEARGMRLRRKKGKIDT